MSHTCAAPPTSIQRVWLFLLAIAALAAGSVSGQGPPPGIAVPEGISATVEDIEVDVVRGFSVEVPLSGYSPTNKRLEYSIFEGTGPEHGTLGEIVKAADGKGARVRYSCPADSVALADEFKYRARPVAEGSRPSSAATVRIRIVEPSPVLQIPEALDFGRVPIRTSAVRDLPVRNVGTGTFVAELRPPAPFSVRAADARLEVPPGEVRVVKLVFEPGESVEQKRGEWVVQAGVPEGTVKLGGRGFAPFVPVTSTLGFAADPQTHRRVARLGVRNPGAEAVAIDLRGPDRVELSAARLELEAGGDGEVRMEIPAADVESLQGTLTMVADGHRVEVELKAEPAPGRVVVTRPENGRTLRFEGDYGGTMTQVLALTNRGGQGAFVSARVNPPFRLLEGDSGREVQPGATVTYTIELLPDRAGGFAEQLRLSGVDELTELELEALVSLPPGVEPPPMRVYVPSREEGGATIPVPVDWLAIGRAEKPRQISYSIPVVRAAFLESLGSDRVAFRWDHPDGKQREYVLETEIHRVDEKSGLPYPYWIELGPSYAKVTSDAKGGRAEVSQLSPGGKYNFRVVTADGGRFSTPGPRLTVMTPAKEGLLRWLRWWMVGPAVLVVGLVAMWRQRRRDFMG